MKYALVDKQRIEPQPGLSGICPGCEQPMIAKCGEVKIWHWAHLGKRVCDPWWENETEWHRNWKGYFPVDWQEVVHYAESGEKHIADVNTDQDWVIEFQHSHLKPEERRARDEFYKNLVWVVDGTRRKRDMMQLLNAWKMGTPVGTSPVLRKISFPEECVLLREWASTRAPVFFDFKEASNIWWLLPNSADGKTYITPFSRSEFIRLHRGGDTKDIQEFAKFLNDFSKLISSYNAHLRMQEQHQVLPQFQRGPLHRRHTRH